MSQISAIVCSLHEAEQSHNRQLAIKNEEIANLKQLLKTKEIENSDLKEKLAFWEKPNTLEEDQSKGVYRQLNPTSYLQLNVFEADRMLQAWDHADRDTMYKDIIHFMRSYGCPIQKKEINKHFSIVPSDFTGIPSAYMAQRKKHASRALNQLRLDGIISFVD